jgi:hypothetical protein
VKLVRERLQLQSGSRECLDVEQRIRRIEDIICSDPILKNGTSDAETTVSLCKHFPRPGRISVHPARIPFRHLLPSSLPLIRHRTDQRTITSIKSIMEESIRLPRSGVWRSRLAVEHIRYHATPDGGKPQPLRPESRPSTPGSGHASHNVFPVGLHRLWRRTGMPASPLSSFKVT